MSLKKIVAFVLIIISPSAQAYNFHVDFPVTPSTSNSSYIAKLFIPDLGLRSQKIDKKTYLFIFNRLQTLFQPVFHEKGETLIINKNWSEKWASAYSSKEDKTIHIEMTGALARHHEMTPLGFTLIGCHELGHYIGGVPHKTNNERSVEGQADYFATSKCLRIFLKSLYFEEAKLLNLEQLNATEEVANRCERNFSTLADQAICRLSSMAAMSLVNVIADIKGESSPQFTTPSSHTVQSTLAYHPEVQCRLDTFFQGALCHVDESISLDNEDPNVGTCNRVNGDQEGLRPLCWYKPPAM